MLLPPAEDALMWSSPTSLGASASSKCTLMLGHHHLTLTNDMLLLLPLLVFKEQIAGGDVWRERKLTDYLARCLGFRRVTL